MLGNFWTDKALLNQVSLEFPLSDSFKSAQLLPPSHSGFITLLVGVREIIAVFLALIQKQSLTELDPWLECARTSLVASFANGVTKDKAAVNAAIVSS